MDSRPADFEHIPFRTQAKSRCSPLLPGDAYRGLLVRVPGRIRAHGDEPVVLPFCIAYRVPTLTIMRVDITVHARNLDDPGAKEISGAVFPEPDPNDGPLVPNPNDSKPLNPEHFKYSVSEAYLYLDGQKYLPQPLKAGSYEVWLTYGPHRSNSARVTIERAR